MAVLQGQSRDDYLAHLDRLRDRGALTDVVAAGSLKEYDPSQVEVILVAI